MNYDEMLAAAQKNVPDSVQERGRFEIPKATGFLEGSRTVIRNFAEMAKQFSRNPDHFQKFLTKELATPGNTRNEMLMLGRKITPSTLNEKIKKYADLYVICPECGKPDTDIKDRKDGSFLVCQACGAETRVKELN